MINKKPVIVLILCIILLVLIGYFKTKQMRAVNSYTKQLINDGYRPDIARHLASVRLFVRPIDSLYITHDED